MSPVWALSMAMFLFAIGIWSLAAARTMGELGGPVFLIGVSGLAAAQAACFQGTQWTFALAASLALLAYLVALELPKSGPDGGQRERSS